MNKKGIFLPLFVFVVVILLGILAFIIHQEKLSRQDVIGLRAVSLIKVYDEAEKINFYLEQSFKYSKDKALKELYSNAGYRSNNKCRKIPASGTEPRFIILDNTCGRFDPLSDFKEIINEETKSYLANYRSSYIQFKSEEELDKDYFKTFGLIPEIVTSQRDIVNEISTSNVRSLEVKDITKNNGNLLLTFSEIHLPIENSPTSKYTFSPKLQVKNDLIVLDNLYKAINDNCISKAAEECTSKLKNIFSNIIITGQGKLLKITLNEKSKQIKLAIDLDSNLPEK